MLTSQLFSVWLGVRETPWILLGVVMDILFSDPPWRYHPVRLIGHVINAFESLSRRFARSPLQLRIAGVMLVTAVLLGVSALVTALLVVAHIFSIWAFRILIVLLTYWGVAIRGLAEAAIAIYRPLAQGHWEEARLYLSMIVGRETEKLDPAEIIRGTIESVAENTCDSIVAPLFFTFLAGPAGLWLYKAANTMDSMIGYNNPQYHDLGWAAAKVDDILNWIPARISGVAIAVAAILDGRFHQSYEMMRKDGRRHPSPNSGISEAAMAGALDVQLGGFNTYHGVVSLRPKIGQSNGPMTVPMIIHAVSIVMRVALLVSLTFAFLAVALTGRWLP
ncbi:MAG: adenosylcobinamide-phosphate synthase CbiB [Firmicutes bacterium]|uniref:Cobalamin biosynthesis protein CobD n=1 Tax=Sulfobacillus benefaciens TaxID=453960 RepID=A0A2T2X2K5_9FIRM|nr:adenosylcobinamide-phosphate synthase CbiB [Bacillota bacterium]PSR28709.1 MAG: cobalamin biosynthesis protein CobD [Sulfobacillus benefaciens]